MAGMTTTAVTAGPYEYLQIDAAVNHGKPYQITSPLASLVRVIGRFVFIGGKDKSFRDKSGLLAPATHPAPGGTDNQLRDVRQSH